MEKEIIEIISAQGVFAVLFFSLLFYVLKENSKREEKYQNIIKNLTDIIPGIKKDIEDIKNKILN